MATYSTNNQNQELNKFNNFRNIYGNTDIIGVETFDLALEFATLKVEWWGSNLVFLGVEEKSGKFYPCFNVFD